MGAAWIYLLLAGFFEIGWPVGLKMAETPGRVVLGILMAVVCISFSGWLLWMAQKSIPMGTAYAVWTGIGATGAFLLGILIYGDPPALLRFLAMFLILSGVILLKLSH
jgi:quaternary ammonium compound-resistance protein SugE